MVNDGNDTGSEDVTVNPQRQLATCSDDGQNSNVHVQLVTATLECAGPSIVDQPNNPLEEVDGYPSGFQGHPELLKTSTAETPLSSETYPTTERYGTVYIQQFTFFHIYVYMFLTMCIQALNIQLNLMQS